MLIRKLNSFRTHPNFMFFHQVADLGILTKYDLDPGFAPIRILHVKENSPFFKFNILFLDFDAALT